MVISCYNLNQREGEYVEYEIVKREEIECLSPSQVKELLNVSKSEAYRLFNSKDFPSFRLGEKILRIRKVDFMKWLEEQKCK